MCEHNWLDTGHTKVCCECGLEEKVLTLNVWNKYSAPLNKQYDRCGRFRMKVDKLLGTHRGPKYTDLIWTVLSKAKETMHTPHDIRTTIRNSRLKSKHYDCVRIFSDIFTSFRLKATVDVEATKLFLVTMFEDVHHMWLSANRSECSFFSYDFLLRYFLEQYSSPLVIYLKPKTNKKRLLKYMTKLKKLIQSRDGSGKCCRSSAVSHFLSESKRLVNPQSQLP